MLHDGSHKTLAALGLAAVAALAACGSSRDIADAGTLQLCVRCHGGANGNAAPPRSVAGATETTDPKVGAHQAHLVAGRLRGPIPCAECHVVPADMQAHEAGIAAVAAGTASRVTFGQLASGSAPTAAWDPRTAQCANTYCHGATLDHGGSNQLPTWTTVDGSQAACGTCHGFPPVNSGHPAVSVTIPLTSDPCAGCHPQTLTGVIDAGGLPTIDVAGGKHIDGRPTVSSGTCTGGACTCCHGAPPATGAHAAHVRAEPTVYGAASLTPATATAYDFGCGSCHSLDVANHTTGMVDLSPAGAPAGSLKERNSAAASYDQLAGTCSGVYCHSTGQATPSFLTSPGWRSGVTLGCDGCHANPPNYANGGAGAATANSHVALDTTLGYEWGHYAGFPGVTHENSKHGGAGYWSGQSSAPITCQTCHYLTAAPDNAGPSAFYYLDTLGSYELSDALITYTYSCLGCHDGTRAPAGSGKVMPHFHVNGARDVAFDTRGDLSGMDAAWAAAALPAGPNTPTRPYWFSNGYPLVAGIQPMPQDAVNDGSTLSMHLQSAAWNPGTKTCSTVACHFNQTSVQWGGEGGESTSACSACHTL